MVAVNLDTAVARAEAGLAVELASLPTRARRAVALATRLGAPRVAALQAAAAVERQADELQRSVRVASAEGRSVARALVLLPPVLGPAAALLVAADPLAVWSTGIGRLVLVLAVVLWCCGAAVVRLLVRSALRGGRRDPRGPGDELLELTAVALGAGLDLAAALRAAADAIGEDHTAVALWLELGARGEPPDGWAVCGPALAGARRDGVALVGLVRALADTARREQHQRALERAARLGARLTVPTTLLLLPAAVLIVAAPLLHGALTSLA